MDFSAIVRKWAKANGVKQSTRKLSRELWQTYIAEWRKEYKEAEGRREADKAEWRKKLIAVYLDLTASMTYVKDERFNQQQLLIREIKKVIEGAKP